MITDTENSAQSTPVKIDFEEEIDNVERFSLWNVKILALWVLFYFI
jgi:hypothetical protein